MSNAMDWCRRVRASEREVLAAYEREQRQGNVEHEPLEKVSLWTLAGAIASSRNPKPCVKGGNKWRS